MATDLPRRWAMRRTAVMTSRCSACVPWEKFNLATSIPARISSSRVSGDRDAGPMVHTIFVLAIAHHLARLARTKGLGGLRSETQLGGDAVRRRAGPDRGRRRRRRRRGRNDLDQELSRAWCRAAIRSFRWVHDSGTQWPAPPADREPAGWASTHLRYRMNCRISASERFWFGI